MDSPYCSTCLQLPFSRNNFKNSTIQQKRMGLTLKQFLLDTHHPNLTSEEITQICSILELDPNCMSWPVESVNGIVKIMINHKLEQKPEPKEQMLAPKEEEESVFDYSHLQDNNLPQTIPKRSTEGVLKDIAGVISNENLFKVLCNKLFKFLESFLADPKNPINQFVALMPEDYGKDLGVVCLLDELCAMNSLKFENRLPKGILIKTDPAAFLGYYNSLKSILGKYKDESLGISAQSNYSKSQKLGTKVTQKDSTKERV